MSQSHAGEENRHAVNSVPGIPANLVPAEGPKLIVTTSLRTLQEFPTEWTMCFSEYEAVPDDDDDRRELSRNAWHVEWACVE